MKMDEKWKYYEGKNVFIILKSGRKYSGKIVEVDNSNPTIIWLVLIDKFGGRILIRHSEIDVLEEEEKKGGEDDKI